MSNNFSLKNSKRRILFFVVLLLTILLCTLPMKLAPHWNGEIPDHRNQYELLADALLEGHLNIEYDDIDENLVNMENPYNPTERNQKKVNFHWDHAFYKGKYYVYFGVAPVILTFIPYKLLTGLTLPTYVASAIYTALFIVGLFLLFLNIRRHLYKNTKFGVYLLLSSAFSILSVWICTGRPALYCTAIISGMCMSVWSLYFYFKAVYVDKTLNKSIISATIGGLFGALIFACRPPLGFINFLAVPLLLNFFKKYGFNKKVILKVLIVLIPYIIIAALLMIYNYLRFENVFEFGQSYQLTIVDQHNYLNIFDRLNFSNTYHWIKYNFIEFKELNNVFPYINIAGIFVNFPLLLLPYFLIIIKKFRQNLSSKKIKGLYITLMILPFVITIIDIIGSPFLTERYRLDIYFILCILTFISLINFDDVFINLKHTITKIICTVCVIIVILSSILLFFVPCDLNYTDYYKNVNPSIQEVINKLLFKK